MSDTYKPDNNHLEHDQSGASSDASSGEPEPYGVGYGKPPEHTRFKKGRSGNPKGRPSGHRNLATDLKEVMGERIKVTVGGKEKTISKQHAMLVALANKAVKGDTRAATIITTMASKLIPNTDDAAAGPELSVEDQSVIDEFMRDYGKQTAAGADDDKS